MAVIDFLKRKKIILLESQKLKPKNHERLYKTV
jgi:hypothetical protein